MDDCQTHTHPDGVNFYVTAMRSDGKVVPLSGPYKTHAEALTMVKIVTRWAWDVDPRGPWYSYGTCAMDYDAPGPYDKATAAPFGPGPLCQCPDDDGAEHLSGCPEAVREGDAA